MSSASFEIVPNSQPIYTAVRRMNDLAFDGATEDKLVGRLRREAHSLISQVALENGRVVGHVCFSPVRLIQQDAERFGMGLGPTAVDPHTSVEASRIGLSNAALRSAASVAIPFVVVLGHKEYYPRFGFFAASTRNVRSEFDVPENEFMVLASSAGCASWRRLVGYHTAFGIADPKGAPD